MFLKWIIFIWSYLWFYRHVCSNIQIITYLSMYWRKWRNRMAGVEERRLPIKCNTFVIALLIMVKYEEKMLPTMRLDDWWHTLAEQVSFTCLLWATVLTHLDQTATLKVELTWLRLIILYLEIDLLKQLWHQLHQRYPYINLIYLSFKQ